MSWKPEVIADSTGKWYGNALRFATREEAESNARDLSGRWTAVRDWRAAESDEPVNYRYTNGRLEEVKGGWGLDDYSSCERRISEIMGEHD